MRPDPFVEKTRQACADPRLARTIGAAVDRQAEARAAVCAELEDVEGLRAAAAGLREGVLDRLDTLLESFVERAEAAGVRVHAAAGAEEARAVVVEIARAEGAKQVVKSKSMLSEEIGLTPLLEAAGMEVWETDLGEFIIQLLGEPPAHIVLPAVHLEAEAVRDLFRERIGYEGPAEAEALTRAARRFLREKFRTADMGISGVNFAVADRGTWAVCTNEGNGRYVTTLPRVYVAVMGIERVVPDLAGAAVILKLLARFATGQRITQYVSFCGGPVPGEGPERVHLVLVDNGRTRVLGSPFRSVLRCIRCGACLNVCPLFRHVGGQVFPGPYSGPIGAVLLPLLLGFEEAGDLPWASTLCGACDAVCPVKIPLSDLLLGLRAEAVRAGVPGRGERCFMKILANVLRRPRAYRAARDLSRPLLRPFARQGWIRRLPAYPSGWTEAKDFPLPARDPVVRNKTRAPGKAGRDRKEGSP